MIDLGARRINRAVYHTRVAMYLHFSLKTNPHGRASEAIWLSRGAAFVCTLNSSQFNRAAVKKNITEAEAALPKENKRCLFM